MSLITSIRLLQIRAVMTDAIDITLANLPADRQLQYENYQVVSAIQALWGAVTPNMIAISLSCVGPEVHLHFYLHEASNVDKEMIDEAAGDLEVLQFTGIPIHTHISVVSEPLVHTEFAGRLIFRRYEPEASTHPSIDRTDPGKPMTFTDIER